MKKSRRSKGTKTSKSTRKSAVRNLETRKAGQVKGGWTKGGGASVG